MLDVPTFFWESEPTLYPLYIAVREYLEIKPRIQVLNERCRVFLDLTEILSDSIADNNESRKPYFFRFLFFYKTNESDQTWIIIILIIISILITTGEVILRFGLLSSNHTAANPTGPSFATALIMNLLGRSGPAASSQTGSLTGAGAECVCPAVGTGNLTW
jgi:hypothetical protein